MNILLQYKRFIYRTFNIFDPIFLLLPSYNTIYIISYHSVTNDDWRYSIDEELIKRQILYLKKHFDIITLKTLSDFLYNKKSITRKSVVISFDDGYKDILKLKSFFKKQKITPSLFVLSNTIFPNWKELDTQREFLTIKDIRYLSKAGWEIGCHSATHSNLSILSTKQLKNEIVEAKFDLEKKLGITINYFAYPSGKYNNKVVNLVKKAKYKLGLTMDVGIISLHSDIFTLPRIGVDRSHNYADFKNILSPSVVMIRCIIMKSPIWRIFHIVQPQKKISRKN